MTLEEHGIWFESFAAAEHILANMMCYLKKSICTVSNYHISYRRVSTTLIIEYFMAIQQIIGWVIVHHLIAGHAPKCWLLWGILVIIRDLSCHWLITDITHPPEEVLLQHAKQKHGLEAETISGQVPVVCQIDLNGANDRHSSIMNIFCTAHKLANYYTHLCLLGDLVLYIAMSRWCSR